jgi:hypothetical protein
MSVDRFILVSASRGSIVGSSGTADSRACANSEALALGTLEADGSTEDCPVPENDCERACCSVGFPEPVTEVALTWYVFRHAPRAAGLPACDARGDVSELPTEFSRDISDRAPCDRASKNCSSGSGVARWSILQIRSLRGNSLLSRETNKSQITHEDYKFNVNVTCAGK